MPVAGSDACLHCGSALDRDATNCPNCGEVRMPVSGGSSFGAMLLMVLAGIVCGLPLAGFGLMIGFGMQGFFGGGPENHAGTRAASIYFIAVTLLLLIGLIVVATRRMNTLLRVFAITVLATGLGLFALCDPIMLLGWR